MLRFGKDKDGYLKVGIREEGRRMWCRVNNLVCRAFHGPPGDNEVSDHMDHNIENNHAWNLRWLDRVENSERQPRNGGNCKLTEEQAMAILRQRGSYGSLSREYGISRGAVADIKKRRTWRHLGA
jgi:hypothetical protein